MSNKLKLIVLILVALCGVASAQPITNGGGLRQVSHSSTFGGTGSSSSPLVLVPCGTTGQVYQWNGSAWVCATITAGITNSAGAGIVTRSDGTNVVASSMTDDGTSVTIAGEKKTVCTSSAGGGIVNLTIPDGCTFMHWSPAASQGQLVGISPPASGTRHVTILADAANGGNFCIYPLNANATTTAWQIEGDITGNSGCWLSINTKFEIDYNTVTSKWDTSFTSDGGSLNVNGALAVTGGASFQGSRIDAHGVYTYTGGITTVATASSSLSGTQTDWTPNSNFTNGTTDTIEITATADVDLISMTVPIAGMHVALCNGSNFNFTIENEGGSGVAGTAADRFRTQDGQKIVLSGVGTHENECAGFYYSVAGSRWIQTGGDPAIFSAKAITVDTLATLNGGATGINGATTTNPYLEWNDDWLFAPTTANTTSGVALGTNWYETQSGAGGFKGVAGHGRPGIIELSQGTTTGGNIQIQTSTTAVDFGGGNWTFDSIVGMQTLSTTSGTGIATALIGFFDGVTGINPTNGCYFAYDPANKITGGANSGLTQDLEAVCQTGGSRTVYLLNGSSTCDASFTKGTVTVAAVTWPSTNVENLKVVMTGATEADFWANGTQVCKITSHIPASGTTMAAGWNLVSGGTGSQTAVPLDIDFSSLSETMNAARSP